MNESRFAKLLVVLNGVVPLLLLGWDATHHRLGANPVNYAIRTTGLMTLIFLPLSLLVTPLRWITDWRWLLGTRRLLGLYAFGYASVHFLLFFLLDQGGSVSSTLAEMIKRKYLLVGSTGLLVMVPLAVTSTSGMIRRLGAVRWKALHRLAYVAAAAGVIHYYMLVKADVRQPLVFAGITAVLLGYRGVHYARKKPEAAFPVKMPGKPMNRPWAGELRVAGVRDEAQGVKTFQLKTTDSQPLFTYLPGQYLNLRLEIDGKTVSRSYTIASSPSRMDAIELTIKCEGLASSHLHERIKVGDVVRVLGPAGRFTFTGTEADRIVLIGGGVGITPLMSVIRYLTDHRWPGEIHLIFAVRTERDVIFRKELEDLQSRFANLRVTLMLSRPEADSWRGERGRITPELIRRVVPDLAGARVHICGPTEMMESVKAMLVELEVPADRIELENFGVKKSAPTPGDLPSPEPAVEEMVEAEMEPSEPAVKFAKTGKRVVTEGGQTVLEAGESVGIELPYDCRSGVCGTCKVRLLAGRVKMESRDALDSEDDAKGLILACQAIALDAVTVDA